MTEGIHAHLHRDDRRYGCGAALIPESNGSQSWCIHPDIDGGLPQQQWDSVITCEPCRAALVALLLTNTERK